MSQIIESEILKIPTSSPEKIIIVDKEMGQAVNWFNWYINNDGYAFTSIGGKSVLIHRLILGLHGNSSKVVDHINGNPLDNRRSNIRICTREENSRNRKPRKDTASPFKGVSIFKESNKYMAFIGFAGEQKYLGLFKTDTEAAKAHDIAARELHGEFARLNFPIEVTNG